MNTILKGAPARPLNVMERLALVESWRDGASNQPGAERRLTALEEQMYYTGRLLRALTEMLGGEEAVQAVIDRQHADELRRREDQQKAATAAALAEGKIKPAEAIGPKSIVVSVEKTVGENPQTLNMRAHFLMERIAASSPPAFSAFLGKTVGDSIRVDSQNGPVTYDVIEIYDIVEAASGPEQPVPAALVEE